MTLVREWRNTVRVTTLDTPAARTAHPQRRYLLLDLPPLLARRRDGPVASVLMAGGKPRTAGADDQGIVAMVVHFIPEHTYQQKTRRHDPHET